jgi:spore coat protein U-like protein
MRKILAASIATSLLAAAGGANAATTSTSFGVSATVLKTCTVSATPLSFGNYTPGAGALAVSTPISVRCTKSTPFTVALNAGTTSGGTITQRLMTNGTDSLQYNLYTTAALATVFGDGTTGATSAGTGTGLANAIAVTVFGNLPDNAANQSVSTGAYSDTINVTVTY